MNVQQATSSSSSSAMQANSINGTWWFLVNDSILFPENVTFGGDPTIVNESTEAMKLASFVIGLYLLHDIVVFSTKY